MSLERVQTQVLKLTWWAETVCCRTKTAVMNIPYVLARGRWGSVDALGVRRLGNVVKGVMSARGSLSR